MQIVSLKKSQIIPLDELAKWMEEVNNPPKEDLEKAVFKHAYYSKLVPKVIVGKDGVKRIHWVNPDKDKKKAKWNLVSHFHEGDTDKHHEKIKKDNEIDLDHVHHFAHGDRVRVTKGKYKGQVGIFTGSYTTTGNSSPRASIRFQDTDGEWKTGNPVGINNIELVHRANDHTKAAVAPKTVEHINRKGQKTVVSKKWKDKKGDTAPEETPKERHERLSKEIGKGVIFQRASDGVNVFIVDEKDDKLHVKILGAAKSKKTEGLVEKKRFRKMVASGAYHRVGLTKLDKDTPKKTTRMLETGELHLKDKVTYDEHGQPKLDPDAAKDIIFENWDLIDRVVAVETAKYPSVDSSEISGIDFLDKIKNSLDTFEPYLNSSVQKRLHQYVKDATRKKASQIHQINLLRERQDVMTDRTNDPDGTITQAGEEGTTEDLGGGGFINKLDALVFRDIINEEAELMKWHVGNDEYVDAVMRMTGVGIGEPTITRKEAARELLGKVTDPEGKPYKLSTIGVHLARVYDRMLKAFKDEAEKNPHFAHSFKSAIEYRSRIYRKRAITEHNSKDFPTIKAVAKKYDGGRNARSEIAAKLIKHGAKVSAAPRLVEMVEKIISGEVVPYDYKKILGSEQEARTLEDTLKEMIPADAGTKVPDRFKVVEWYKHKPKDSGESLNWLAAKTFGK